MSKLVLAGVDYEIAPLVFGQLRKLIPMYNRAYEQGIMSEASLADASGMFAVLIGKSQDEVDAMQITFEEMVSGIAAIPEICGLVKSKDAVSGEAMPGTTGTNSTST